MLSAIPSKKEINDLDNLDSSVDRLGSKTEGLHTYTTVWTAKLSRHLDSQVHSLDSKKEYI